MSFPQKVKPGDATINGVDVLDDNDKNIVKLVDPEARGQLVREFSQMNLVANKAIEDILNTQPKIDQVRTKNIETKKNYYDNFITLYNELVKKFEQAYANRDIIFCAIVSGAINYNESWKGINLETWKQQNSTKTNVINCFLQKLRNNGWEPQLEHVDDYKVRSLTDDWGYINGRPPRMSQKTDLHEGGKTVRIKCHLSY